MTRDNKAFIDWSYGYVAVCCIYTLLLFTDKNMLMRFTYFLVFAIGGKETIHPSTLLQICVVMLLCFFCTILAELY